MLGPGCAMQRGEAGMDGRNRRLPECRRHLHWMHHAGLSRQIHAVHEPTSGVVAVLSGSADLWTGDSRTTPLQAGLVEQGAKLEDESPAESLMAALDSEKSMSTFWQMDGGAEHEADSAIAEEKELTPEAAEAILTGLAGTYAKDFDI